MKTEPASAKILAEGLNFPEGPAFDQKGRLWFVELKAGIIACYEDGHVRRFEAGGAPNGIAIDHCGVLWFCDAGERSIRTFDPRSEVFATVCDSVDGQPLNKPNDLAFDSAGNLLFTCPGDSRTEPTGYVCCRKPGGEVFKIREGMFFPNGLVLMDAGRSLVVAETYRQRLWRGAWDADTCTWSDARPWAENLGGAPGPDGMAVHEGGALMAAIYGGGHVQIIGQNGNLAGTIKVAGKNPTNVAFDPSGRLGLVVTEAEQGRLISLHRDSGHPLFDGRRQDPPLSQPFHIWPRKANSHLDLNGEWSLSQLPDDQPPALAETIPVTVPDSVQWSLYEAGRLPHPYVGDNTHLYRGLDRRNWRYERRFQVAPDQHGRLAFLCFDGVDYDAVVWLNGRPLGAHEGMFGGPVVEVSSLLKSDEENELVVEVHSGIDAQNEGGQSVGFETGRLIKPWYWRFRTGDTDRFTVGIWRGVRIEFVSPAHLERPFLVTEVIDGRRASLALNVEAFCDAHSLQSAPDPKGLSINPLNYQPANLNTAAPGKWQLRIVLTSRGDSRRVHTELVDVAMSPGRNWLRHSFEIEDALLWWPNGLGSQDLYDVEIALLRDGEQTDSLSFAAGIRTITTARSPGPQSRDRWDDWQFVANGQPFFAKGVNWAPIDYFLHLPREQYRWMLELARDAGIQLIRVNAYGLIETEEFYDLCDEFGILVWQDFVIANTRSSNFPLDVWKNQILTNIFRLRNRASLAVYCGGNEFNAYSPLHVAAIGVLEAAITDFDGTRLFRRVSPDHGSVHEYPDCDATWLQHFYRWFPFLAEIGVHSFPHADSIRRLVCAEELDHPLVNICDDDFADAHPQLTHHFAEYWSMMRSSRWPRILNYASAFADVSAPTIEDLCEASQMAAAEFYQMFSDAAQANYPITTGLMPWVFARPFLQVAMQLVDASGTPIPSYYALRRSYESTHAIVQFPHLLWAPGEQMPVTMKAMHSGEAMPVNWSLRVLDAGFMPQWERSGRGMLSAGPSVQTFLTDSFEIPAGFAESLFCIIGELRDDSGALISRSVYWPRCLDRMKEDVFRESYRAKAQTALRFDRGPWLKPQVSATRTTLRAEYRQAQDGQGAELLVSNTGNAPAFPVNVRTTSGQIIAASDAYFLLMPGESRLLGIRVRSSAPITGLTVVAWNAEPVEIPLSYAKTESCGSAETMTTSYEYKTTI